MKKQGLDARRKWLIFAGFLISGGGQGALSNALSPFVRPVTESLGFPRGAFTLYTSIVFFASMILLPVYGELYRKKRFPVMMVGAALRRWLACSTRSAPPNQHTSPSGTRTDASMSMSASVGFRTRARNQL